MLTIMTFAWTINTGWSFSCIVDSKYKKSLVQPLEALTNINKTRFPSSQTCTQCSPVSEVNKCKEVLSNAQSYVDKINDLFQTKIKLITDDGDVSAYVEKLEVSFDCENSIVLRAFKNEPDCIYGLLGHEISHILLPDEIHVEDELEFLDNSKIYQQVGKEMLSAISSDYARSDLYHLFHHNMDTLSAKLMKYFGVPRDNIAKCERLLINDFVLPNGYVNRTDKPLSQQALAIWNKLNEENIQYMEKAYDEGLHTWSNFEHTYLTCFSRLDPLCKSKMMDPQICQHLKNKEEINIKRIFKANEETPDSEIKSVSDSFNKQKCVFPQKDLLQKNLDKNKTYLDNLKKFMSLMKLD